MNFSCRKLQSLGALIVKAQSFLLAQCVEKHLGSAKSTKLCLSSLVIKRGLICCLGPLFGKFKIKSKKADRVEQG